MERIEKTHPAIVLLLAMVLSMIGPRGFTYAAAKPHLSQKSIHVVEGEKKVVRVSSPKKGKVSLKAPADSSVAVSINKKTIKKNKPIKLTVKGKSAGSTAVVTITVKLEKAIQKKKKFKLDLTIYVDPKETPTPEVTDGPELTTPPVMTPVMTQVPTMTPSATPSTTPTMTPTATPSATPSVTPLVSPTTSPTDVSTPPGGVPSIGATPVPYNNPIDRVIDFPETPPRDDAEAQIRILSQQEHLSEGYPFGEDITYDWLRPYKEGDLIATLPLQKLTGCEAFAALMSDAAFGKDGSYRRIDRPDKASIRIGDVIWYTPSTGGERTAIVIGLDNVCFFLARIKDDKVHWDERVFKDSIFINYIWTRW